MSDYAQAQYIIDEVTANSNTGIPPRNMKNIIVSSGDGCAKLTFTEPQNTEIDGQLVCTVKGVSVVRKEGSAPHNINDGILVLQNEVLGKYSTKPYTDNGLENNKTYFYAFFPYSDHGVYNYNVANVRTVVPKEYVLYGFKIDKKDSNPATRVTYLEMAAGFTPAKMNYTTGKFEYGSWNPEEIFFLQNNYPAMVRRDGTEEYRLDPEDYTKRVDGTASDISDPSYGCNAMARFDTVWLYQYEDANYEYCYVCNIQLNNKYHAYAHQRADGSIMDYIWLSCFDGSLISEKVRSVKGQTTMNTQTGTNELTYAKANGELWNTRTWSQRNMVNMLLILMGKSDNTQTVFGNGHYSNGSSAGSLLKTGTLSNKGRFYGTNGSGVGVKVFHVENWWGNTWDRIAGLMYVGGKIKTKMVPPYNTTGDGYTDTGVVMNGSSGGYISETKMTENGRLPVKMGGSDSTFTCDGGWYNASQVDYGCVGGYCSFGLHVGASAVNLNHAVSVADWHIGAALSCEQPLAA